MTRVPYDQAAKALLHTALATLGHAEVQREVAPGEPVWIDVVFEPAGDTLVDSTHGLLGAMATTSALFEAFSDAPSVEDVLACLRKQLALARDGRPIPALWIISGGRPDGVIRGLAMRQRRSWPRGIYAMRSHALLPISLVVVPELPERRDTLLVRLMGSGATLRRAVRQTRMLPDDSWERRPAVAAVTVLRSRLDTLDPPDQELAMEIRETYEQWEERVTRARTAQGKAQGKAEAVLRLLRKRFGAVDPSLEQRVSVAPEAELDDMLDRVLTASSLADAVG